MDETFTDLEKLIIAHSKEQINEYIKLALDFSSNDTLQVNNIVEGVKVFVEDMRASLGKQ
jgi:hypothetical protein